MHTKLVPIHANAIFTVSTNGEITQALFYDYYDPEGHYAKLTHNPDHHKQEIQTLHQNMQYFLDKEKIIINQKPVLQKIEYVNYDHHGMKDTPYVYWVISFKGDLKPGINTLESQVALDTINYDFEILWRLPTNTTITQVDTPLNYEIHNNILTLWGRKGDTVGGKEIIYFILPDPNTR